MVSIKKVTDFIESKYPIQSAEKWDRVGLQYGNKKQKIENVLVTLDLTTEVFEEALEKGVDLIITHHPFLWEETEEENIENAPYKNSLIKRLKNVNMSVYSAHTNYDAGKDGTAFQLSKLLGFKKSSAIKGSKHGIFVETEQANLQKIKDLLWDKVNLQVFRAYCKDNATFNKIALFPGSGDIKDILKANEQGADLIITSDIKWSDYITFKELDINVLEVSHGIEDIFTKHMSELLRKKFKDLNVYKLHTNEIIEY